MLDSKLEKAIKEAFKLEEIKGGAQAVYEKNGEQFPVMVQLIWVVEIFEDYLAGATVVGVKTRHMDYSPAGYMGLLLIPPVWEPLDRDFGGKNLKPVEMEWPNAIFTVLESMNIVPYEVSPFLLTSNNDRYKVHTYTKLSNSYIEFDGDPVHENQRMFLDAVAETVFSLAEAMGDLEILEFLDECENMTFD